MAEVDQAVQVSSGPEGLKDEPLIQVTPKAIEKIRQAFAKQGVTGALRLTLSNL